MASPATTRRQVLRGAQAFSSFSVNDLKRARAFYGETLGLTVREEKDMGLNLEIPGANVFIYAKPDHQPATFTVLNFEVDDLTATMEALSRDGVSFERYNRPDVKTDERGVADWSPDGPKMAWFKDPAGNVLSVIEEQ